MRFSTKWLKDYLTDDCRDSDVLDALKAAGLEVEAEFDLKKSLCDLVIGFVRSKRPLFDRAGQPDGTFACEVETAPGQTIQIVCGSEHPIEPGWGVPIVQSGQSLPFGKAIENRRRRHDQVVSQGMMCLDSEMGLVARDSGLHHFTDEALLGASVPSVIPIHESLVEVSVLPNRPDCLGIIGIAREVAAILGVRLKYPTARELRPASAPGPKVFVEDPSLCPRFLCEVFTNVQVGPSPHWLKSRLQIAGQRPLNNVVDITNFVMLEWGQPLHAYDSATLSGNAIGVRRMRPEERLRLIKTKEEESQEREEKSARMKDVEDVEKERRPIEIDGRGRPLAIVDDKTPIALAGIIGGWDTQTTSSTRSVLLEAACFDPVCIRQGIRDTGIKTDAGYRFERGTDPNQMLTGAFCRAAELLQSLAGAVRVGGVTDHYPTARPPRVYSLTADQVSRVLGEPFTADEIRQGLESREMACNEQLTVHVPTWRVDVNDPVVLIEDVARSRSYDKINTKALVGKATRGQPATSDIFRSRLANSLASNGFLECRTAPLRTAEVARLCSRSSDACIELKNYSTSDMTTLRQSLVPSLFTVADNNARHGVDSFRYFEIDRIFSVNEATGDTSDAWAVGGLLGGPLNSAAWMALDENVSLLHAKGLVQNLLHSVGIREPQYAVSGPIAGYVSSEVIDIQYDGASIGVLGLLDKSVLDPKSRIRVPLYGFELELAGMVAKTPVARYREIANTPSLMRDLSLAIPAEVSYAEIRDALNAAFEVAVQTLQPEPRKRPDGKAATPHLQPKLDSITCVGLFIDPSVGVDRKSLTLRIVFHEDQHTLTSGEAQQIVESLVAQLRQTYHAVQR